MPHQIVSRDEWLAAREALLAKEKAFTKERDALSQERRRLPCVKFDKTYVFVGPAGKETLADLFARRNQLLVYHFMFGPDWNEGCPGCSFWADNYNGAVVHRSQRDVSLVAISRSPLEKRANYRKRLSWSFTGCCRTATTSSTTPHLLHAPGAEDGGLHLQGRRVRVVGGERVRRGRGRPNIPHLFLLCARAEHAHRLLDLLPKGRERAGPVLPDDLGAPARPARGSRKAAGIATANVGVGEFAAAFW
jgi:hypothetical protein